MLPKVELKVIVERKTMLLRGFATHVYFDPKLPVIYHSYVFLEFG